MQADARVLCSAEILWSVLSQCEQLQDTVGVSYAVGVSAKKQVIPSCSYSIWNRLNRASSCRHGVLSIMLNVALSIRLKPEPR
jgi:hypothetical protein